MTLSFCAAASIVFRTRLESKGGQPGPTLARILRALTPLENQRCARAQHCRGNPSPATPDGRHPAEASPAATLARVPLRDFRPSLRQQRRLRPPWPCPCSDRLPLSELPASEDSAPTAGGR